MWRLLEIGEAIEAEDEIYGGTRLFPYSWSPASESLSVGRTVGKGMAPVRRHVLWVPDSSLPDPGKGYRIIDKAKDIPKPGDEYWNRDEMRWMLRADDAPEPFLAANIYRRKLEPATAPEPVKPGAPDPGFGYFLIDQEMHSPQPGDEVWRHDLQRWILREKPEGRPWDKQCFYRRKFQPAQLASTIPPDPGEGYRLLGDDEVIESGDSVLYALVSNQWEQVEVSAGYTPAKYRQICPYPAMWYWRRKVAAPAPQAATGIDPGEGWRLLAPDEPVQQGDECVYTRQPLTWMASGNWNPECATVPGKQSEGCQPYRRRIVGTHPVPAADPSADPGAGYRLLEKEEPVLCGDEYLCPADGIWKPSNNYRAPLHPGRAGRQSARQIYRRKIAADPAVEPGDGYRLLARDERVLKGDEFRCPETHKWCFAFNWCLADGAQGPNYYRRKIDHLGANPEAGEGFRLIDKAVEVPHTGDQYWYCGQWVPRTGIGRFSDTDIYRRLIVPDPEYRLLAEGEVTLKEDAVCGPDCVWRLVANRAGYSFSSKNHYPVRRIVRIQSPGYRYLDPGERICCTDDSWGVVSRSWSRINSDCVGLAGAPLGFRRKTEPFTFSIPSKQEKSGC